VENRRIARILCVLLSAVFVVLVTSACFAADNGFDRYGIRVRGIYVIPDQKIDSRLSGLEIQLQDAVAPEIDLEYFITKNISAELVLALVKDDIMLSNGGINAGSVWLLPPSLLVKYHPLPNAKVSPYVGFGMNVVMPFDERLTVGGSKTPFKIDSTIGWAAQVGADIPITKHCFFNVDAKYYSTGMNMTIGGTKYNLDINPFILGTGIGVRF
jgi:outer membrane protein